MTQDQIADVIEIYEPTNITDVTATKISISDMLGDIMFICPSEEFGLVYNISKQIQNFIFIKDDN